MRVRGEAVLRNIDDPTAPCQTAPMRVHSEAVPPLLQGSILAEALLLNVGIQTAYKKCLKIKLSTRRRDATLTAG
jgi:hypothetical protein